MSNESTPPELPKHTTDPYERGRREWQERYGDIVQARDQWKLVSIALLFITLLAVAGMVAASLQNHMIPYVVKVDHLGMPLAVGRASEASPAEPAIVRAQLARWIQNTRSVYVDATAQRAIIDEAYALVEKNSAAQIALTAHYRENEPFVRAERETVAVKVHSALPLGANNWRIEWTETVRARNGQLVGDPQEWQAVIIAKTVPPADEQTMLRNPLGTYIQEFSWTKRL